MFYAHFVLAKKGPLARIWLAAHWDNKLTKAQVYETNIEESVQGIMQPKVKMALRTSGHLLLGVVKIYSRKAKYLLADCNEAFAKIKMAFRPGMVDLPLDKREAAINAITLPDYFHDIDTEIPSLEDMVDIDGQFVMAQTRADEITLREDYGAMMMDDNGFYTATNGDGGISLDTPEVMRDAGQVRSLSGRPTGSHFGSSGGISLEQDISRLRDLPPVGESSLGGPPSIDLQMVSKEADFGTSGLGIPEGEGEGLFEAGLTFGGSVREPEQDLRGPPSPVHSDAGDLCSRSESSLENTGIEQGMEEPITLAPPTLDQTPISEAQDPTQQLQQPQHHDQTTLLQNEDESFALAPVEASALRGEKRKRKRKLVVDAIKAISGEEMKVHLTEIDDIITTLDIAPPTKKLMMWKEMGGVDELFSLPCHPMPSGPLSVQYRKGLHLRQVGEDHFSFIRDHPGPDLHLDHIAVDLQGRPSPVKGRPAKRKRVEDKREESSYAKRQQELVRQQEELGREIRRSRQETVSVIRNESFREASFVGVEESMREEMESIRRDFIDIQPQEECDLQDRVAATTISLQQQDNLQQISGMEERLGASDFSGLPLESLPQTSYFPRSPGPPSSPGMPPPSSPGMPPSPSYVQFDAPSPSSAPVQEFFNEKSQGQCEVHTEQSAGEEQVLETNRQEVARVSMNNDTVRHNDSEMLENETAEAYEDRVVNKRAALLHRVLENKFQESNKLEFSSLVAPNSSKKQVCQTFYSFLVLNKHDAIIGSQDTIFAPIFMTPTTIFAEAIHKL